MTLRCAFMLLACWAAVAGVRAHDPGLSTVEGEWGPGGLELINGFAPADAAHFLPAGTAISEQWTPEEFERLREPLVAAGRELWQLEAGGRQVAPMEVRVEFVTADAVNFHLRYPGLPPRITLRAQRLGELPTGHRQFIIITDERGSSLVRKLLSPTDAAVVVERFEAVEAGVPPPAAPEPPPPIFWGFFKLGVEHIWLGYDHLLFLFALLVACRRFSSIVAIVSCFTVAHSLTLALATVGWADLPGRWVEPAIAASIAYVGVENIIRRGREPRGRWALTFGFGLIHGFGFASVLRDLGVNDAGGGIAVPLLAFNLGVEVGQIAIAAVVLPLLWRLQKNPMLAQRTTVVISAAVALAGLYWFLERTVFA